MQLDHLIGKLLLHNNCVVVPAFGGFVASRVSAQIDAVKGLIAPPHKAVLFNKQLVNNDGLLVHAYAQENDISFDEAARLIEQEVSNWQKELSFGRRILLEQVGYLYQDNEKNLCFEQDRFHNLLLSSFGLGKVQFIPETANEPQLAESRVADISIQTQREDQLAPIVELKPLAKELPATGTKQKQTAASKEAPIRKLNTKRLAKYVAAACLIPLGFYSVWIPMKTDVLESGLIAIEDFNPFRKAPHARYSKETKLNLSIEKQNDLTLAQELARLPESVEGYSYDLFENGTYYYIKLKDKPTETIMQPDNIPATDVENQIQVLAGSFSSEANALILKKELEKLGFAAFTYKENSGLTRVSAGKFATLSEAETALGRLEAAGKAAWILK